jgi:hypothetical protein
MRRSVNWHSRSSKITNRQSSGSGYSTMTSKHLIAFSDSEIFRTIEHSLPVNPESLMEVKPKHVPQRFVCIAFAMIENIKIFITSDDIPSIHAFQFIKNFVASLLSAFSSMETNIHLHWTPVDSRLIKSQSS